MAAVYLGSVSVGGALPSLLSLNSAALAKAQLDLAASVALDASLQISASDPLSALTSAVQFVASGQALAGLTFVTPTDLLNSINLSVSANAAVTASLTVQVDVLSGLANLLSTPGVHAYAMEGPTGSLASDLQTLTSAGLPGGAGPSEQGYGIALLTNSLAAWVALQSVVKTT